MVTPSFLALTVPVQDTLVVPSISQEYDDVPVTPLDVVSPA
jgi:hypothetical protein